MRIVLGGRHDVNRDSERRRGRGCDREKDQKCTYHIAVFGNESRFLCAPARSAPVSLKASRRTWSLERGDGRRPRGRVARALLNTSHGGKGRQRRRDCPLQRERHVLRGNGTSAREFGSQLCTPSQSARTYVPSLFWKSACCSSPSTGQRIAQGRQRRAARRPREPRANLAARSRTASAKDRHATSPIFANGGPPSSMSS